MKYEVRYETGDRHYRVCPVGKVPLEWVASFDRYVHPNAEQAARRECARLNGLETEKPVTLYDLNRLEQRLAALEAKDKPAP